jgi:hypothetical protein
MKVHAKTFAGIAAAWLLSTPAYADEVFNDVVSQSGGIQEGARFASSSQLNYRVCNSGNSDMQALLKINIIGTGSNQVPAGSTIISATLELTAEVGGDGLLYRCAEPWVNLPTWDDLGDVFTSGPFIGIGLNSGQQKEFDVTSHVQAWANGASNYGWVIKGDTDDCQAARIYNGSAGAADRPRLRVEFTPPTSNPGAPKVSDVDVGSSVAVLSHSNYDVPVGSGQQIKTIPVGRIDEFYVTFNEDVSIGRANFRLLSLQAGANYQLAAGDLGFNYISALRRATFRLASPITTPDQVVLVIDATAGGGVRDATGNLLDGNWIPIPECTDSTDTDTFNSGDGSAGGNFGFQLSIMPGDATQNNLIDQASLDRVLLNWGKGMLTLDAVWSDGDTNGNGWVEQGDLDNVLFNWGLCYKDWLAMDGGGCGLCESENAGASAQTSLFQALDACLIRLGMEDVRAALKLNARTLLTHADRAALSNDVTAAMNVHYGIGK